MVLTPLQILEIEVHFRNRCIAQEVKYNSKRFKVVQAEFFAGVMAALHIAGYENAILPKWTISIFSSRDFIEPYKLKLETA